MDKKEETKMKRRICKKYAQVKNEVIWDKIVKECRQERENAGITQAEVAKDCGCAACTISQWERGIINNGYILAYYLFILPIENARLQEAVDKILR